jgi:MFS family permease
VVVAAIDLPISLVFTAIVVALLGIAAIVITAFGLYSGIGLIGEALFGRDSDIVGRVFLFVCGCIGVGIGLIPSVFVLAILGVVNLV